MTDPRLLTGKSVRNRILKDVKTRIKQANSTHELGRLVSISIGKQPEIEVYIRGQARTAEKIGIPFDAQFWPSDISQDEAKARIFAMNDDAGVLGIILQTANT